MKIGTFEDIKVCKFCTNTKLQTYYTRSDGPYAKVIYKRCPKCLTIYECTILKKNLIEKND